LTANILGSLVGSTGLVIGVLIFVIFGVIFLKYGADALVSGSSNLGLRLGISTVLTGLTIVAFGTSAPELFVSTLTAIQDRPEICLGNVIGSNLANIALILGVSALIVPMTIRRETILKEGFHSFLSILLVFVLALLGHQLSRLDGVILLLVFSLWMAWLIYGATKGSKDHCDDQVHFCERHWSVDIFFSMVGLLGLVLGANFLVEGAILSAKTLGVPDVFIGLTVVAIGTSLPELAVSVSAALKGHPELTVGNVFGSNIFNALLILGVATVISPIEFVATPVVTGGASTTTLFVDLPFTALVCFLILPLMMFRSSLGRIRGLLLIGLYLGFMAFLVYRVS
jgi:cation:H+ antiporter